MTVTATHRVSGPYTCDGSKKTFSFDFKVFAASDVSVAYGDPASVSQTTLSLNTDFTVTLNSDQDESPGGSVTTVAPPPKGMSLSITSKVDATQEMQLTNQGGFYPTVINSECDKLTILIQQINEQVKRCVKTSTTTTMTPDELTQKLLSAADSAYEIAKSYADAAGASAAEAAKSEAAAKAAVDGLQEKTDAAVARVEAAGDATVAKVNDETDKAVARAVAEGDAQVKRIKSAGDQSLIQAGLGCGEVVWTLESAVEADGEVTIPTGLRYVVGRHHLRVAWNGIVLFPGSQFEEVGDADTASDKIKSLMPMSIGDELDVWVGALGTGNVDEAITTAAAARDAVADLSRRVVYKDEESASK